MGQILSNSEIEAILSSLDFVPNSSTVPSATQKTSASDALPLYDFEHPEPLKRSQLEALRFAAAAADQRLQTALTSILRTSVCVTFLGVEQSTYHDYLVTSETPGCLAVFESNTADGLWLLEIGRSLAFTIVDCMLGGQPRSSNSTASLPRPFTNVESRLIERAIITLLPEFAVGLIQPDSLQMTRLVPDGSLIPEVKSNDAVALISFEVGCGPSKGLMQLCIPWKHAVANSQSLISNGVDFRELVKAGASKIPVIAKVSLARLKLSTRELSALSPGDVLVTDATPEGEIEMDIEGQPIFRGTPGTIHDRKVILLTKSVATGQNADAPHRKAVE